MSADRPARVPPSGAGTRRSLIIGVVVSAVALGLCAWLIVTDAPAYRFVVRLYEDKQLMHAMLARWGGLGAGRLHRHPSPAGDYRADPGRGHRPPRRLCLRPVARLLLLDDRADHRLARCLLGRPPARCHVRSGPAGAAGVGAHGLPRRG